MQRRRNHNPHFNTETSRQLDSVDAATDELTNAWTSITSANRLVPDLPIGGAIAPILGSLNELRDQRSAIFEAYGL